MRRFYFLAFVSLSLLSCSDSSKTDKEIIKEMEKNLISDNGSLNAFSEYALFQLQQDQYDIPKSEKVKIWLPIASSIVEISENSFEYIDNFKKSKSISLQQIDSLLTKLKANEQKVLNADKKIGFEFLQAASFQNDSVNKIWKNRLSSASEETKMAILSTLQNNIKRLENKTIVFCKEQIGTACSLGFYSKYSVFVGQNAKTLRQGEQLEVMAGVGAFSKAAQPDIKINNRSVAINDEAYSSFKMKISQHPGTYSLPVEISYFDTETGRKERKKVNIEYTVSKECDQ